MRKSITVAMLLLISVAVAYAQRPSHYNLKKGDKFTVTSEAEIDMTQEAMGQSIETAQAITVIDELEVTSVDGDTYTIKSTGIRRRVSISSSMMSTEMDSDLEGEQNVPFKLMTGKSYSFKMSKYGKVLELIGLETMKEDIKKEMVGTIYEATSDQILTAFDRETLMTSLQSQFDIYDSEGKNEWSASTKAVVNNIPIEFTNNYKWDNDETILAEAEITMDGSTDAAGMTMKMVMKGNQQTIFDLDKKSGMPVQIQTQQTMSGDLEAQGMKIPMTMKTESKITIEKK